MKKLILGFALFGAALSAQASDLEAGKDLVESDCLKCHIVEHGPDIYQRGKDGRVHSFPQLQAQVQSCVTKLGIDWFPEDVGPAAEYLNHEYYKFKK